MILTDCYIFQHLTPKAVHRIDCVASTKSYEPFEVWRATKAQNETPHRSEIRVGDLIGYITDNSARKKGNYHREATLGIEIGKFGFVSSLFVPDPKLPYGYGDVKGTSDALLFVFKDFSIANSALDLFSSIEVYIARGQRYNNTGLYMLLTDGGLDEEMAGLRESAYKACPNIKIDLNTKTP